MAQNPDENTIARMMAIPQQPTQMAVDPHTSLTAPISPAPVQMSNELGAPLGRTNELGDALPDQAEESPEEAPPKMSALSPQREHLSSRLMGDYAKDDAPAKGFFGHIMKGIDDYLPGVAQQFRGTRDWREKNEEPQLEKRLQDISKDESTEGLQGAQAANQTATAGKTEAETPEVSPNAASNRKLQGAEAEHLGAETQGLKNPPPNLAVAYAHAVNDALTRGDDPAQDPIVQHLSDAITSLQKQPADKALQHVNLQDASGHPMAATYDPASGKYTDAAGNPIANPVPYEKPNVTRVSVGETRAAKNDVLKAYQPTLDSAERMNVMTESYEKAIKDHDQQAMLNLLANHLGMTMGLQKGARITKDLYQEAAHSTPWLAKVGARFDKDGYLSGVTLNPNQMRQMVDLAQSRYSEDAKKSRSTAAYLGAPDDGPQRIPGKATIRFYLGKANGDPAKAKSLAEEDGWNVK